jgi:hypothetical protein
MSSSRRNTGVVSRRYKADPSSCDRALKLLLEKSMKKGARPGAPDDRKGSKHDPAKVSISQ